MLVITSTIMHGEPHTSAAEAHRRVEPRCSRSTGRGQHRHGDNRWPHSVASSVRSLYTSARSRERAARRDDAEDARDADRNGRNDFRQCLKQRVCEIARLLYEATRKLVQSLSERNTKRAQIGTAAGERHKKRVYRTTTSCDCGGSTSVRTVVRNRNKTAVPKHVAGDLAARQWRRSRQRHWVHREACAGRSGGIAWWHTLCMEGRQHGLSTTITRKTDDACQLSRGPACKFCN